jgi:hypothetical protein
VGGHRSRPRPPGGLSIGPRGLPAGPGAARALEVPGLLSPPERDRDHPQEPRELRGGARPLPRGLAAQEHAGDTYGQAVTLGNMGVAYHLLGQLDQAIECYERALALARKMGDPRGESFVLGNLAELFEDGGQPARAPRAAPAAARARASDRQPRLGGERAREPGERARDPRPSGRGARALRTGPRPASRPGVPRRCQLHPGCLGPARPARGTADGSEWSGRGGAASRPGGGEPGARVASTAGPGPRRPRLRRMPRARSHTCAAASRS